MSAYLCEVCSIAFQEDYQLEAHNKARHTPKNLTGIGGHKTCLGCGWNGPEYMFEDHCLEVHDVTRSPRHGAHGQKILSDGREATLYPTLFGARFLIGPPGDMGGDEEFMFDTFDAAIRAFLLWDGYGQPDHWTRWKVGSKEYVRWTDGKPISKEDRDKALREEAEQRG